MDRRLVPGGLGDRDLEADPDPPDWTRYLDDAQRKTTTTGSRQRALPYTEPSHVRNLKVLDRVFYRPCLPYWTTASAILLICSSFNLPDMLEILPRTFQHTRESGRKRDQPAVETVGDILVAMVSIFFFDGSNGEAFQQAAATFCKYQSRSRFGEFERQTDKSAIWFATFPSTFISRRSVKIQEWKRDDVKVLSLSHHARLKARVVCLFERHPDFSVHHNIDVSGR
uniref:Uncharacterized protein n=1 Tax=Daphnia galeata TaxID=27404 RepID=A0A8J2RT76_9CRUS|nr:unnamed protein product [Daphnia galeata]